MHSGGLFEVWPIVERVTHGADCWPLLPIAGLYCLLLLLAVVLLLVLVVVLLLAVVVAGIGWLCWS